MAQAPKMQAAVQKGLSRTSAPPSNSGMPSVLSNGRDSNKTAQDPVTFRQAPAMAFGTGAMSGRSGQKSHMKMCQTSSTFANNLWS